MVNIVKQVETTLNQTTQEQNILEDEKLFKYRIEDIKSRMKFLESK